MTIGVGEAASDEARRAVQSNRGSALRRSGDGIGDGHAILARNEEGLP